MAGSGGDTDITDQFTYNAADNLYTRETTGLASESLLFVFADKNALGIDDGEITQHLLVTGEQVASVYVGWLDSTGGTLDEMQSDASHTYLSSTQTKADVAGARIHVNVPEGYTFKAYFNGTQLTNFNESDSSYGNYVATIEGAEAAVDGTWVVEFKKKTSVVMDFVLVGDVDSQVVDFDPYDKNDDGTGNDFQLTRDDLIESVELASELDGGYAGFSVQDQRAGDKITVFRNGVDVTDQFTPQSEQSLIYAQFGEGKTFDFETSSWVILIQKSGSNYDVNGDGTISIADVTKLVNVILGKE